MTLTKKINYKNHKTRRYRGGMIQTLRGMLNRGPPPPLVPVTQGTNVTFSGTQVPNPILKQPGAVPPSILQTDVGQRLVGFIEHVKRTLKNKGRAATDDDIRMGMNTINMTEKILDYPESSNLENYILLTEFFENTSIEPLVLALQQTLQHRKGRFDREEPYDVSQNFQSPTVPNEDGKIGPRRFLSLMVLSSRMCLKYKLRSNPECELFLRLNELFQGGNGQNFNSASIARVFNDFIRTNSAVTSDYVKRLVDGERIYEIYRGNYFQADRELSKQLIKARLDKWLKIVSTKDFIIDVPVSYLFNKYSTKEKDRLNKDFAICQTVSEFSDKIGKPSTMDPLLPPSAFNIEQNDSIDFDKINEYLYKISPPAVKKRADKAHRKSLKKKIKLIGH